MSDPSPSLNVEPSGHLLQVRTRSCFWHGNGFLFPQVQVLRTNQVLLHVHGDGGLFLRKHRSPDWGQKAVIPSSQNLDTRAAPYCNGQSLRLTADRVLRR